MRIITFNCPGEFDIDQFGDFDLFFIQRCPEAMPDNIKYQTNYIRNYVDPDNSEYARGLCIVSKYNIDLENRVETGEFEKWVKGAEQNQGRYWQKLHLNTPKGMRTIINSLPSFPSRTGDPGEPVPESVNESQLNELLSMVDDTTVLVGDFHNTDAELNNKFNFNERNLYNYIRAGTFTCPNGQLDSIDKIITRNSIGRIVYNIIVHRYDRDHLVGHWPISFNINWSG